MLATFSLLPTMTYAQAISGDIVGSVMDKSGGAIPNATVAVENVATGVTKTTTTNERGEYRFGNLPVGTYNLRAVAANFAETTISKFEVELNKISSLSITLQVGKQVTTIEVSGAPPPINTTSAQIENTFSKKESADLPIASIGLGVINLALLQAGVASSGGVGAGIGPSVGGQRPRNNNFTIEGVDNNNKSVTGPLVLIPNDAVEEFSALQNQYSPEFGHSTGGQFNTIVVSGTNQFHGKAYEYFQNRNLNAVDASVIQANGVGSSNPRYDFNRVGGQVGGPILKNKLFFFGNFEYSPLGQASVVAGGICTPTAGGYTALAGIAGLSANNLAILKQFGTAASTAGNCGNTNTTDPTGTAGTNPNNQIFITNPAAVQGFSPVDVGNVNVNAANFTNFKYLTTSMDYDFSAKDQIRGRYIYNSAVGIDNAANLPAFFQPAPAKFHLVTLAEYHTFNSAVQNELRIGFNRFTLDDPAGNFKFPGLDSFPNLVFFDLGLQVGPNTSAPQFNIQNLYQATDNVSWVKGNHSFKFGMEARKFIAPQSFTQRSRGDYDYNTLDVYLHDLNPDNLSERSLGDPIYYGDQIALYWFVNDNWKIRRNLTVNLGLRHEYSSIPFGERDQKLNIAASVPGLYDSSEPRAPKKNFMPRVGLAWSPGSSGTTSIRAGFGLGYDVLYDNIGILSLPPQLSGTIDTPFAPVINNFLGNGGILPIPGGIQTFPNLATQRSKTANHIVVNQKDPVSVQWDLGVQHSFGSKYSLEVRYLGTHGYHLNVQQRINRVSPVTTANALPTFLARPAQASLDARAADNLQFLQGLPSFGAAFIANNFNTRNVVQFSPDGNSIYHGLAIQGSRRFSNGLQLNGAYTWSRAIDDSTADFFTTVITPRRAQDFQNLRADRSVSALNRTHRFTLSVYYDLPYFKNGNWMKRNLLGNWLFAPIYTYQSPEWADVQSGTDSNLNGDAAGDRVLLNPAGAAGVGSAVTALCTSAIPVGPGLPKCGKAGTEQFVVGYLAANANARYITAGKGALEPNNGLVVGGRNTLATRPINNFDLTAGKKFNLTEGIRFEFQAQFLNLFNHPQFAPGFINRVDYPLNTFAGGGPANFTRPQTGDFNKPQNVFSSNSRNVQLTVKLVF